MRVWLLASMSLLLVACASTPVFDAKGVDRSITPSSATANMATSRGKTVLWGGVIVAATNLKDHSQLEVLGYPLDSDERPDQSAKPLGRFLIEKSGYLETVDYAQGRLVSARGQITGTHDGRIGETRYTYPVLRADQLHLWPKMGERPPDTQFHFGIGVIFH